MAKYKSVIITNAGLAIVAAAHSGNTIEFTSMKAGNGTYDGTEILEDMASLKSVKQTFGISGISREAAVTKVRSVLSNKGVTEGYYLTEIGLYALDPDTETEVLYAIVIAEDGVADYFPHYSDSPQSMTLEVYISTTGLAEGVTFTASIVEGTYVTTQDFEDYRGEVEAALEEKLDRNMFYIEKATINQSISNVDTKVSKHTGNENNPHNVTKKQIGLGNVDNTADMDKPMSTATKNALQEHTNNTDNPHNVTAEHVGLGNVDNTSDKDKPVSDAMQIEIDKLKQAIIDVDAMNEASGSPILLTDTASGVVEDIEVYGRSTQTQYSGKNLYNCVLKSSTVKGVTFTLNADKSVTAVGTATETITIGCGYATLPAGTYTINGAPAGSSVSTKCLMMFDGTKNVFDQGDGTTFTLTKETTTNIQIVVASGVAVNDTFYPMIRLASVTDGTYEPYVGGEVSPNPDYNQDMSSIGNSGWFDGELLQGYYATNGTIISYAGRVSARNLIPCSEGDVIKLTYEESASTLNILYFKDNVWLSQTTGSNVSELSGTVPSGANSFGININNDGITPQTAKHICVTINDKYALIVKSKGKNLLKNTATTRTINGVTFTVNEDKSVTVNGVNTSAEPVTVYATIDFEVKRGQSYILSGAPTGSTINTYCVVYQKRLDATFVSSGQVYDDEIVLSADDTYNTLYYGIYIPRGQVVNDLTFYPMIRPVGTNNAYEPYKEDIKYIPISAPLRGIGEVKDEITCKDGVYGVLRRIYHRQIVSCLKNNTSLTSNYMYYTSVPNIASQDVLCNSLSKKEISVINGGNGIENVGISGGITASVIYINVGYYLTENTVNAINTWLAENPTYVQYIMAEPIFEPLTESVDIVTYNNTTYITASDDADMWVQYYSNSNVGQRLAKINAELDKIIELLQNYTGWVVIFEAQPLAGSGGSTGTVTNDIKYKLKNSIVYLTGKLDALHWVGESVFSLGGIDATIAPTEDIYFNIVGIDSTDVEHTIPMVLKISSTGAVTILKNTNGKAIVNDICINVSYPIDYTGQ